MTSLDPTLTCATPQVSLDEISAFVERRFGISGDTELLNSEKDLTLHLRGDDGQDFTVKVANAAEETPILDLQVRALDHLSQAAPDISIPRPCRSLDGAFLADLISPIRERHKVWVTTFLPGSPIAQGPLSAQEAERAGGMLARLDQGLAAFSHPAAARDLLWDHGRLPEREALVETIADPALRARTAQVAARMRAEFAPQAPALRRQVIHNDLNPHNIVRAETGTLGVIDFGDMCSAPLIQDLAVALSYLVARGDAPLGLAPAFARAYDAIQPLTRQEREILPLLVAARAGLTLAVTSWRSQLHPANAPYILRNAPSAVRTLERLAQAGSAASDMLFGRSAL